jgi:hypothetical protein
MRKTGLPLILFGLMLVFSLHTTSANAQATRTWVSGVGDDVNPCSRTAPCKTFAGAISKTAAGGEIDCLDPGGFGAVTITKGMTIDCGTFPGGVLNAGNVNGVIVNAQPSDKVVLRNLVINGGLTPSGPGLNGIRWLAGKELHLDRVVVQGDTTMGIDVNRTAPGNLYVRNSYFTEVATGINMTSTAAFVVASIDGSHFNGISGNCIAVGANSIANISNSVLANCGVAGASVSASGAFLNLNNNTIQNSTTGVSAVSGANLRMSNNDLYDNSTGISAAGASFLSAGNNRVSGGTTGTTSSGAIPLR